MVLTQHLIQRILTVSHFRYGTSTRSQTLRRHTYLKIPNKKYLIAQAMFDRKVFQCKFHQEPGWESPHKRTLLILNKNQ